MYPSFQASKGFLYVYVVPIAIVVVGAVSFELSLSLSFLGLWWRRLWRRLKGLQGWMWRRLLLGVGCLGEGSREGKVAWARDGSEFYSEMKVASMKSWPFSVVSSTLRASSSFEMYCIWLTWAVDCC